MRFRVLLPILLVLFITGGGAVEFPVNDQAQWLEGSFDGTAASSGSLQLGGGIDLGNYTSEVFDAGDVYDWTTLDVESNLNGGSVTLTVYTSEDDFSSVHQQETFQLTGGTESFDLSLAETRWIRFNVSLSRGSSSPTLNDARIGIGGPLRFIIRDDSCLPEEQELFSFSNLSNAHAGDPGYWPDYALCGSGLDDVEYTNICSAESREVLSFFGSQVNTTHLSPEAGLFAYKLCTRSLSIGVRDVCPNTTRALVSLYEAPESHIAEPGLYPKQLCGGRVNTVMSSIRFTLGPNDTVYLNQNNISEGAYSQVRDSGFLAAENDSMVAGIVAGENTQTLELWYGEGQVDHVFNMTQDRSSDVSFYLPFTRGDHLDLEDRRLLIADGDFLNKINPNFGLRFVEQMLVRLTLQLTTIDIVNDLSLPAGFYNLVIENVGTSNGKPEVALNATTR